MSLFSFFFSFPYKSQSIDFPFTIQSKRCKSKDDNISRYSTRRRDRREWAWMTRGVFKIHRFLRWESHRKQKKRHEKTTKEEEEEDEGNGRVMMMWWLCLGSYHKHKERNERTDKEWRRKRPCFHVVNNMAAEEFVPAGDSPDSKAIFIITSCSLGSTKGGTTWMSCIFAPAAWRDGGRPRGRERENERRDGGTGRDDVWPSQSPFNEPLSSKGAKGPSGRPPPPFLPSFFFILFFFVFSYHAGLYANQDQCGETERRRRGPSPGRNSERDILFHVDDA